MKTFLLLLNLTRLSYYQQLTGAFLGSISAFLSETPVDSRMTKHIDFKSI